MKPRHIILLEAVHQILQKCEDSHYVLNFMEETANYDGTECDGYCLMEDIKSYLEDEADSD